jgi:Ca2+-binding EF-hand superfamily protein
MAAAGWLPFATAQQPPRGDRQELPTAERFDQTRMVFMAPSGPVFAELRLAVSGKPYRQWIGAFLAKLLDTDSGGTLAASELSLMPKRFRQLLGLPESLELSPALIASTDTTPPEAVSLAQFQTWVRSRLPQAFNLIAQPQAADDAVRLSTLLDTDTDGAVSPNELQDAARILRFRDLDDDETLTLSELLPYRDPLSQQAPVTPTVANLPFFHLTDDTASALAAARIIRRYGQDLQLTADRLRIPQASSADSPHPSLSQTELQQLIQTLPVHLILEFKLSDKANLSDLSVQIAESAGSFCQLQEAKKGQTVLLIDGLSLTLRARGGGANDRMITRGLLGQNFAMADGDRSQSLDETEYQQINSLVAQAGVSASFNDMDTDRNQQLSRTELLGYVDREQAAVASSIEVGVEQQGKTLFSRLDIDADRRLTRRELHRAADLFARMDIDGNQSLSENDLQTQYILTIGLGRSDLRRSDGMNSMRMMMGNNTDAILPPVDSVEAPIWFQRMDRNLDGDVSLREFPGTVEMFQQLDSDRDGLISAAEAAAASPAEAN